MTQHLTQGQHQALRRRIHRRIRGMLNDVEALEKYPHRMRGIREAAVSERIGSEEIAEFIVPARGGDTKYWDQCSAQSQHRSPNKKWRQALAVGEAAKNASER